MDKVWLKIKPNGKIDIRFELGILLSYKFIYYKGELEKKLKIILMHTFTLAAILKMAATAAILVGLFGAS